MSTFHFCRLRCDVCKMVSLDYRNESEAVADVLNLGWRIGQMYGHSLHLCHECGKRLPDYWPAPCGTKFHWEE